MFSLTVQGTLHHGRKCRLQDREAAGPVTSTVRNRRGLLSSLSPFYIALNSCPGNGCTHNYSGASSTNIIKITPQRPTFPMRLNAVKLTISMNHSIEKAKQFFKKRTPQPWPQQYCLGTPAEPHGTRVWWCLFLGLAISVLWNGVQQTLAIFL